MRQFTTFTVVYLAAGAYLVAIALRPPAIASNVKTTLLLNAGWICLAKSWHNLWSNLNSIDKIIEGLT